jgi:hypothetical protein
MPHQPGTEQSLWIESRRDVEIECLSGLLWITQPGDARDLFVAAGESLRLAPSELTLVTAMRTALLRARELPPAAGISAWRRWPARPGASRAAARRPARATIGGL